MTGLRVTLGVDLDAGVWPGTLGEREASFGEVAVGPLGLLGLLEAQLGLGAPWPSEPERAAALVPGLPSAGLFGASARLDPLASARRLLHDRDLLVLHGWQGQGPTPRLAELASATKEVLPGVPDRLSRVAEALERRSLDLAALTLVDPLEHFAPLWQRVFTALGDVVTVSSPAAAPSAGDLAGARQAPFVPSADGSLQLVRPYGPVLAAEDLAAWLAARARTDDVVIVGGDATLDQALATYALPTAGAAGTAASALEAQLLSLILELVWEPPDPARVYELVCLRGGPVPPGLAWSLARALTRWPAVGSPAWDEAFVEYERKHGDDASFVARARALFTPLARRGEAVSRAALTERVALLGRWAQGRRGDAAREQPGLASLLGQCSFMTRLLLASGAGALGEAELLRLVELCQSTIAAAVHPACAGLRQVARPGAVLGPAEVVVWWGFARSAAERAPRLGLWRDDILALERLGLVPPDAGRIARERAARWRRPLELAKGTLLLVAPRKNEVGEDEAAHPLWDEIVARVPPAERQRLVPPLVVERPGLGREAPRRRLEALPLPSARHHWRLNPARLPVREAESATSLEALVSCSFKWLVTYGADARDAALPSFGVSPLVVGSLAHHILGVVLGANPVDSQAAGALAERTFDAEGPRLLAPLFLPGNDAERAQIRRAIAGASAELVRWLASERRTVVGVEHGLRGADGALALSGTLDALFGPAPLVVDFKWSGRARHAHLLGVGAAHQLATYAQLYAHHHGVWPEVAFFIIKDALFLAPEGTTLANAVAGGPGAADSWRLFARAVREVRAELAGGVARAMGVAEDDGEPPIREAMVDAERVHLPAKCDFCELEMLCGRAALEAS